MKIEFPEGDKVMLDCPRLELEFYLRQQSLFWGKMEESCDGQNSSMASTSPPHSAVSYKFLLRDCGQNLGLAFNRLTLRTMLYYVAKATYYIVEV